MSLAERRGLRLFTLCVMYVAQGIPWAFTAITLPAYLSASGVSDDALGGVLAMTTLPYSFKWAWGFLIDAFPSRRFGRRRPWIVLAQGMMALTIGAMILIPDLTESVRLLAWMVFIHTVFNSMQDVAVDALAVDLLDEAERGRTNGMMYASKYIGGAIGGTGLAHVIAWTSLRGALIVQTAILASIMLLPLLVRERPIGDEPKHARVWTAVIAWAKRTFTGRSVGSVIWENRTALRSALLVILVMLISNLATALLSAIGNGLFTRQLGWDPETYATLVGGWGLVAGGLGAAAGGYLADRVGHRLLAGIASLVLAGYYVFWSQSAAHWASHTLCTACLDRATARRDDDGVAVRAVHGRHVEGDRCVAVRDLHGVLEPVIDPRVLARRRRDLDLELHDNLSGRGGHPDEPRARVAAREPEGG